MYIFIALIFAGASHHAGLIYKRVVITLILFLGIFQFGIWFIVTQYLEAIQVH